MMFTLKFSSVRKKKTTTTTVEDVCAIILNYDSINTPSSYMPPLKVLALPREDENGSENTFLQLLLQKRSAVEIYGV